MDDLTRAVAERVSVRVDTVTGRLRAPECAAVYQEIGLELGIGWAAVRLRVPEKMRPSDVEVDAYRRLREQQPAAAACMGCAQPGCEECARLEREYGEFADDALESAMRDATALGGLSYLDVLHELWRRTRLGLR